MNISHCLPFTLLLNAVPGNRSRAHHLAGFQLNATPKLQSDTSTSCVIKEGGDALVPRAGCLLRSGSARMV